MIKVSSWIKIDKETWKTKTFTLIEKRRIMIEIKQYITNPNKVNKIINTPIQIKNCWNEF